MFKIACKQVFVLILVLLSLTPAFNWEEKNQARGKTVSILQIETFCRASLVLLASLIHMPVSACAAFASQSGTNQSKAA